MKTLFQHIRSAFHEPSSRTYRIVQSFVWFLIVLSIVLVIIDLMLPDSSPLKSTLLFLDRIVIGLFVVELVLRVASFRPPALDLFKQNQVSWLPTNINGRIRYCFEPFTVIDILTILGGVPALRGLRVLRLLRLLRLLKSNRIFRYSNPFYGVLQAFEDNALLYGAAFVWVGLLTGVGGVSIYLLERGDNDDIQSIGDGLWWALVTLTTVGFGDIAPESALGRVVGSVLMIGGMFTLALFAGIVGSTLLQVLLTIRQEQFRMSARMNHVIICGYQPGARMLLDALSREMDMDTTDVVIFSAGDRHPDVPMDFDWMDGDPTKESHLDKVRLAYASAVIVVGQRDAMPQIADATTILTIFTLRSYLLHQEVARRRRLPLYIVAEVLDEENVAHAKSAGADEVIETTQLGFSMLTHAVTQHGSARIMGKLTTAGSNSLYLGDMPEQLSLPMSFGEISSLIKSQFGALVIGLHSSDGEEQINPPDDQMVKGDQRLIYIAEQAVLTEG